VAPPVSTSAPIVVIVVAGASPRRRCTRRSRIPCSMGRPSRRPQSKLRCGRGERATLGSGGARKYGCDQTGCGGLSVAERSASAIQIFTSPRSIGRFVIFGWGSSAITCLRTNSGSPSPEWVYRVREFLTGQLLAMFLDLLCMDQPVDAVIPAPRGLMRCGRSSGVPAPAYGSGRRQQLRLRPLDARWFASAARDR
jgi:hypothetical protein